MNNCIFAVKEVDYQILKQYVFLYTKDFMVYRKQNRIVSETHSGDSVSAVPLPLDYKNFDASRLPDGGYLIRLNPNELVDFRPDGRLETMCYDEFDVLKAPVSLPNGDLIFPCRSKFGVQIVHAESQTLDKVCQTQTWKVPTLEDFLVIGDTAFAILGKSFVVACDMKTGALKWRKFYSGIVNPQLIPYHNGILYTCQNVLYHVMDGKDAVVIRIPSTQIDRLECVIGNRLYAIATDSSTILCIDLLHKRLLWELATRSKIEKTVAAKGIVNGKLRDILVAQSSRRLAFVDLYEGSLPRYLVYPCIDRIRECDNYLLGYDISDKSLLLKGDAIYVEQPILPV